MVFKDFRNTVRRLTGERASALVAWPVGSIYFSVNSANPSVALGGGTWVLFGAGRAIMCVDVSQTEFDTVEETGGSKTHTLTTTEMPVHQHAAGTLTTAVGGGHTHPITRADGTGTSGTTVARGSATTVGAGVTGNDAATLHQHNIGGDTTNAGSGGAHNNLGPYITAYVWKRTA